MDSVGRVTVTLSVKRLEVLRKEADRDGLSLPTYLRRILSIKADEMAKVA